MSTATSDSEYTASSLKVPEQSEEPLLPQEVAELVRQIQRVLEEGAKVSVIVRIILFHVLGRNQSCRLYDPTAQDSWQYFHSYSIQWQTLASANTLLQADQCHLISKKIGNIISIAHRQMMRSMY